MIYKRLGRTGLEISRLSFGAMRLPTDEKGQPDPEESVRVIHRAFDLGVNYIDSAVMYCQHQSEAIIGQALKGWRDRVYVSTKNHYYGPDEKTWWANLENSLKKLDVDYIDAYHTHSINWKKWEEGVKGPNRVLSWMTKAYDQGLIRHICCSFHGSAEDLEKIVDTGAFESVTLQYNLLDRSLEPVFPRIVEKDMGIVVMGPVGGGRLGGESEALRGMLEGAHSVPEVALRFVLANPYVTAAISGMNAIAQVEENCAVGARPESLSEAEHEQVLTTLERFKGLADLYCTGCDYCMPCPHGVDISGTFLTLNTERVYGLEKHAQQRYKGLVGKPTYCVACGACEPKCPQNIPIRVQLREAAARFDPAYGRMALGLSPVARTSEGIQFRAQCHNLSDAPAKATVRLSAANGLRVSPDRFEVTIGEPFQVQKERFVVAGTPANGVIRLNASIHDAAGSRTESKLFAVSQCLHVRSAGALREASEDAVPLSIKRAEQVYQGEQKLHDPYGLKAWAAYTSQGLLLLVQVQDGDADVTVNLDVVLDLRNRRADLPPGYHENMWLLRLSSAAGARAEVRVPRGELDARLVALERSPIAGGAEWRVAIPWEALGGYSPKPNAGFGFEIAVAVTTSEGEVAFRAGWSAHPRAPRDATPLGTLFLEA